MACILTYVNEAGSSIPLTRGVLVVKYFYRKKLALIELKLAKPRLAPHSPQHLKHHIVTLVYKAPSLQRDLVAQDSVCLIINGFCMIKL